MNNPLVSIIVVNWNAEKYLQDCLTSLENQTYQNFQIIVVDNASSDGSVKLVEKNFPKVHVIKNNENLGFAEGNNIGIKNAKGDLISLFNPDAVADKCWLSDLILVIQHSEKIAAVGGKIFYLGDRYGKDAVFCTWPKINPYTAMAYNYHDNEPASKVDYLSGAAMMVKKEVITKIGLLDKEYFLYFEETDWCARMIRAGYDLMYVPHAKAWHVVSGNVSDSKMKTYYMERSRIRFALKNFDLKYLFVFLFYFFAESAFVFIRDLKLGDFTRSRIRLKAMFWNLRNIGRTISKRKENMSILRKNGTIRPYNKSLPLKDLKTR